MGTDVAGTELAWLEAIAQSFESHSFAEFHRASLPALIAKHGRLVRDEIEGFREFIAGAELDRLRRMNEPGGRVQIDPEMIPYAIALDLKEAWGDQLGIKTMMETDL